MKLMDANAWIVNDAPAVVEGVDLLKNRGDIVGALDGRVAAYLVVERASYFVTTNTDYVPDLPPVNSKMLMVRRDMRYGPDDPVLWPHLYTDTFCHLAAIPKAPTSSLGQSELTDDFVCAASGLTVTRGLGRLFRALIAEYDQYTQSLPAGTAPPPLLPQLAQTLRLSLERLRIPTTYTRMRLGVVSVQREYLELTGLLRYMTRYKPRMDDHCIGCFTDNPRIAQLCWQACLPFWLIHENILRVVKPFAASDFLEMVPAPNFPPLTAATDRLEDRLRLLHSCTQSTPWYRDPFAADGSTVAVASTSGAGPSVGGSSQGGRTATPKHRGIGHSPYAAARAQAKEAKAAQGPNPAAKTARDKFQMLDRPEMAATINAWTNALAAIDRSKPPACGVDLPQRYVLPEPALLASPDDESRRRMYYHHYMMLRDGLLFRLTYRSAPVALLTTQEWRDVLQGKLVKQGMSGSRARSRSATIEDLLRPAFEACGINVFEEFPVPLERVPAMRIYTAKELSWELAEINFRYEFLSLDARASRMNRPDECCRCFAGEGLIPVDFRESQRGLGSLDPQERLPYLLGMASLMCAWSVPCNRPPEIDGAKSRPTIEWDGHSIRQLERKITSYYTRSFYEIHRLVNTKCSSWARKIRYMRDDMGHLNHQLKVAETRLGVTHKALEARTGAIRCFTDVDWDQTNVGFHNHEDFPLSLE
ncbi:hypothetical protein R3P38DRAFT_3412473 [Favolaschia claudopus]|uniref:Uncharacterized protein n=1 Tax=Favolaschia claudopus TaxID=2862362 RepID=A0AAV9Z923_9AGAR